jgi:hypothetical protein
MYGHDITIRDQANVVNIERFIIQFEKGDTKQMWINDFFKNKECKLDLTVEIISLV